MSEPWGPVGVRDGRAVVRPTGTPVTDVLDRLEAGDTLAAAATGLALSPPALVDVLTFAALGDDSDDAGPALVQERPARPKLGRALGAPSLAGLFPEASRPVLLGLAAGLLLVHDFWDESHQAAQEADDLGEKSVSAYWHGIAHRREPDPGNASYWFRRVGKHPLFRHLAPAARPRLDAADPALAARLMPGGAWDPYAFIEFCTRARGRDAAVARAVQRLEMTLLLKASVPA